MEVASFQEIHIDKDELIRAHWNTLSEDMQFAFTILSKFKFSESLTDPELVYEFRKRFQHLPLQYIDCVFVHSLDEPEKAASVIRDQVVLNEGSQEALAEQRSSGLGTQK